MLMPRRVKHRKVMRGRMSGLAKGGKDALKPASAA